MVDNHLVRLTKGEKVQIISKYEMKHHYRSIDTNLYQIYANKLIHLDKMPKFRFFFSKDPTQNHDQVKLNLENITVQDTGLGTKTS